MCYPLDNRALCAMCHVRRLQRHADSAEASPINRCSTPNLPPYQHPECKQQLATEASGASSPHRFPVVDATIDDDQASWSSSSYDVAGDQRRLTPLQQQHQQPRKSEDTSSIGSSVDRLDDVSDDVIAAIAQSASVVVSRSSSDTLSNDDDRRAVNNNNDDDNERQRKLQQLQRDKITEREDEEDDVDDDDDIHEPTSDSMASSTCGGGADSGHGSGASDDTLTSSSDTETLDASVASTPTTTTSSEADIADDAGCAELEQISEDRDSPSPTCRGSSESPATLTLTVNDSKKLPKCSSSKDVKELIARQLNCDDLDSCRVTDL